MGDPRWSKGDWVVGGLRMGTISYYNGDEVFDEPILRFLRKRGGRSVVARGATRYIRHIYSLAV